MLMIKQMEIQQCVCQVCILSPLLFILYSDAIFKEASMDMKVGIQINRKLSTLKYADDSDVWDNNENLHLYLQKLNTVREKMGLKILSYNGI